MLIKKVVGYVLILTVMVTLLCCIGPFNVQEVSAAENYPVQEFRIGIGNSNRNVSISDTKNGAYVSSSTMNGNLEQKWTLSYISNGVYKIVNSKTGYVMTNNNGVVTTAQDNNGANQRWIIQGVQKDHEGYFLYYKIVSNANSSLALTMKTNSNSFGVSSYTGDNLQKFKLNCDGIEGFAANCTVSQGEKAGAIGGLLGKTVQVNNARDLINALNSTEPMTVVLTGNIDMRSYTNTRIRDNKTLVGSYSSRTIQDCQLRTNNENGVVGDNPSDNIIIRNINFEAVNNEDKILVQVWSSRNIWIDHCNFNSKLNRNVEEVGKFIWINTPYANYRDKKDLYRSPDYITISYSTFKNRFWTVAYGTQNGETSRVRTTLMYNVWDQCVRRCPQIGNGNGHIYNNLFFGNDRGNDNSTSQIIGGDGSNIVSEKCRFQSLTGKEIIAGQGSDPYRDNGSYTSKTSSATPQTLNFTQKVKSNWNPGNENYGYSLLDAYNTKGTDTKNFCQAYAGAFNSYSKVKYITDSDMSKYVTANYRTPFLKNLSVGNSGIDVPDPSETLPTNGAKINTNKQYVIRNVGSGLSLDVENCLGANGSDVQQNGINCGWFVKDAGNGYYYIISNIGDGKTYYLDVENGLKTNGTNIAIWSNTNSDAQLFKFIDNGNGSYVITTKVTNDQSCLGVSSDSKEGGATVVQWARNGKDSQSWILEPEANIVTPAKIDTSKQYVIRNVNSGFSLDVENCIGAIGTDVQQNAINCGWSMKDAGNGYYYIISDIGNGKTYYLDVENGLKANGTNIAIWSNTNSDAQLFKFIDNGNGSYVITTKVTDDQSCLGVGYDSKDAGATVIQWERNGNNSQNWILEEKIVKDSSSIETGVMYAIRNVNSGLSLDVEGCIGASGTDVQQNRINCGWSFADAGDGYYYIISDIGDAKTYYLDLSYGKKENGTNIGIWTYADADARKFKFIDNGDGSYVIATKSTNDQSCLGVSSDSTEAGATVVQWERNGKTSQSWTLEKK